MKARLTFLTALFSLGVILLSAGFYFSSGNAGGEEERAQHIVALNEIARLNERGDYRAANEKIGALQEDLRAGKPEAGVRNAIPALCGASLLFLVTAFGYVYFAILRPFDKLKAFAARISAGDFDVPLRYERSNYFGAFTWAFDSMRSEIARLRAGEREAIENNKTVIATLSHDIKTPIASIRAYAEGLSANMDSTFEKRGKYLSVLLKKCDEVARLTDDLLLHSVTDLDKLKIVPERTELCSFAESVADEARAERDDLTFRKPGFTAFVDVDRNRFAQVCGNIINNARKYAKTEIEMFFTREEECIVLHFRDYGEGIPDENLPFLFDKFYRGSNCGSEQGSGLGLYIVKYVTEKMGGTVALRNLGDGLEVQVILPLAS